MQPQAGLLTLQDRGWPSAYDLDAVDAALFADITTLAAAQRMLVCVAAAPGVTQASLVNGTAAAGPFVLGGPKIYQLWIIQGISPGGNPFAPYAAQLIDSRPTALPGQTVLLAFEEFPQEGYAQPIWQVTGTPTPPASAQPSAPRQGLGPIQDPQLTAQ